MSDADDNEWSSKLLDWYVCRHLLSYFESPENTRHQLTGTFAVPISGPISILPADLLEAVVDALLKWQLGAIHPQDRLITALSLRNFMLTCRGASAVVTRAQRLEQVARACLRLMPPPDADPFRPYYALNMAYLRSCMECGALGVALNLAVAHCASLTSGCCRSARDEFSATMLKHFSADPSIPADRCALEALGPGRTRMAVSVAGGKDALLLCETDHGAACFTRHNNLGWRIHCVKGGVPEAFSPECELPITYEKSLTVAASEAPAPVVAAAASAGDLLVLWMANHPKMLLETWDMKTNELLDSRPTDPLQLHMRLWVCNDTVYWMYFVKSQVNTEEYCRTFLYTYMPRELPKSITHRGYTQHLGFLSKDCVVSTARYTGDLAILNPLNISNRALLLFWESRSLASTEVDDRHTNNQWVPNCLVLSPAGDTMVYLGRTATPAERYLAVYKRNHTEELGWHLAHTLTTDQGRFEIDNAWFRMEYSITCAFSPCGGKLCMLLSNDDRYAACLTVDLCRMRTSYAGFCYVGCPKTMIWSRDGIYLQTRALSGVVRIGSL
jgi:hypothetical protein